MTAEEFKERFLAIGEWLYSVAYGFTGSRSDAEDAVQTLYLRLWQQREQIGKIDNERLFCRRMLLNICIDNWRKVNCYTTELPEFDIYVNDTADEIDIRSQEAFIRQCIKNLPVLQQRIINMSMSGVKAEEISEITGLSIGNVRTTLSRARKILREKYRKG